MANDVRRPYYAVLQFQNAADAAHEQAEALREMNQVVVGRYVGLETALPHEGMEVRAETASLRSEGLATLSIGAAAF